MVLNTGIGWIDAIGTITLQIGVMWLVASLVVHSAMKGERK